MSRQPLGARAGPASFVLPSTNIALRGFHQSSQLLTPRPLPCLLPPFRRKQGTKRHRAAPLLAARPSPGTDKGGCSLLQHSLRTNRQSREHCHSHPPPAPRDGTPHQQPGDSLLGCACKLINERVTNDRGVLINTTSRGPLGRWRGCPCSAGCKETGGDPSKYQGSVKTGGGFAEALLRPIDL